MTNLHAPEESTLRVRGLPTAENRWTVQCLNCEAPLTGAFCATCGQRAVPPHPTMRELAGYAASELSGWDGKFAITFRLLMGKPGELTRQWIAGRRVSFIAPIRLYLAASLLYFAISSGAPNLRPAGGGGAGGLSLSLTENGKATHVTDEVNKAIATNQALRGPERDSAMAAIAKAPALFRPMFRRAIDEPDAFKNAIRRAMPNVFLGLVPVLGLILALFYRRRHYPEHLFFAIHLATFIFLARALGNLALYTRSFWASGLAQAGMLLWILAYGVMALRRVYGGSVPMTLIKGIGICLLYALVATPVIVCVAFLVVST